MNAQPDISIKANDYEGSDTSKQCHLFLQLLNLMLDITSCSCFELITNFRV